MIGEAILRLTLTGTALLDLSAIASKGLLLLYMNNILFRIVRVARDAD